MTRLLPLLAVALAAAFFGIALYINLAEQPARLALADGPLLAQWKASYSVGFMMQAPTAMLAGLTGLAAWWLRGDRRWLAGGLLMLANWPWTLIVIAPVTDALNATAPEAAGAASRALIEQWGLLHAGRTLLAAAATALFVWACFRRPD